MQPKKTSEQILSMRRGGRILASLLSDLRSYVAVGMTGVEVNDWVKLEIAARGATPTYQEPVPNFPGVICISVNDAIVHGVPTNVPFRRGDVVSFDLVISYEGMKTDSATTVVVGENPNGAVRHLLQTTERSLLAGIAAIRGEGTKTGDIGEAVEKILRAGKLGVVRELVGHGVGIEMHMPPEVPNFGKRNRGETLHIGDTIAIEPMATLGSGDVQFSHDDGWTYSTKDGSLSAHFEHTVLITESGADILTV